jgi:hypothetical protein
MLTCSTHIYVVTNFPSESGGADDHAKTDHCDTKYATPCRSGANWADPNQPIGLK